MNSFNFFLALGWFFLTVALFTGLFRDRVHPGSSLFAGVLALICFGVDILIAAGVVTG